MRSHGPSGVASAVLHSRLSQVAVLAGIISWGATVAVPAFAGTAYSNPANFSAGGYSYTDESGITTTPGQATIGNTFISSDGGTYVPSGYMGAQAIIYYANGSICRIGSTIYNGSSANYLDAQTSPGCGFNQTYYNQGDVSGWTGSRYSVNGTFRSPNQTATP
jgi:hypothetical protein